MKTLILLILTPLVLVSTLAGQAWQPVQHGIVDNITGIDFVDADNGFLCTHGGQVGITRNGGTVWQTVTVDPGVPLEDISFANDLMGLVCGRDGALYRTITGGRRWEDHSMENSTPWLLSVEMADTLFAVAVGMTREEERPMAGLSLVSADGGQNWRRQESMGLGYGELFHAGNGPIYFQSFSRLHMSRDGGQTWRTINTIEGRPGRVTAIAGRTGILAGAGGLIAYSHDNGKTWQQAEVEEPHIFTSLVMLNSDTGWVAGHDGIIMRTEDGGVSWTREELPDGLSFDIYDMARAGNQLIAVGTNGVMIRRDIN
ncbi:hypothetical protein GF420_05035 [candidate division GN15 bacterium]|nr:hypothetical protein [candidate division GN15 bacterium]